MDELAHRDELEYEKEMKVLLNIIFIVVIVIIILFYFITCGFRAEKLCLLLKSSSNGNQTFVPYPFLS